MKKFVFYWHMPNKKQNIGYWEAPNFKTAKREIMKYTLIRRLKKA